MDILIKGIDFDPRFSNKILGLQLTQLFKFLRRLRNSGCLSPKLDALTHNFMDFKEKWTKFGADMVPQKLKDTRKDYYQKQREQLRDNRYGRRRRRRSEKKKIYESEDSSEISEDGKENDDDSEVGLLKFKPDYNCSEQEGKVVPRPKLHPVKAEERMKALFQRLLDEGYTEANLIIDL